MQTPFDKFCATLKSLFMLDVADELDFGIYRIMNIKRRDIEEYLSTLLRGVVKEEINKNISSDFNKKEKELEDAIHALKEQEMTETQINEAPKVKRLREELKACGNPEDMQAEVFTHLNLFFSRYYDKGDFISMRRYKQDVYAIPYEGQEVKLHWANADQYYIKTGEYFSNYRFRIAGDKRVEFTLKDLSQTELNNNKAQKEQERRFALYDPHPLEVTEDGTLHIYFTYELMPKAGNKQETLMKAAFETIKGQLPQEFWGLVTTEAPTAKDPHRTLLQKHLKNYSERNTSDYFIHKNLKAFLSRELDFYIKNEVLYIDDITTRAPQTFLCRLAVIKAMQRVGGHVIALLSQLEDYQKRLWLKKKFVVAADYCITLDRIPTALYAEICANDRQRDEWVDLFAINEIEATQGDMFGGGRSAYSEPLTEKFLAENPHLVLDTAFFSASFKQRLLTSIENIDEACNGLLVNSENFQALRLLQTSSQVKCIYIDPPYNTGNDGFTYKDNYQHSSWLAMMSDRLRLARNLMAGDAVIFISIDDKEVANLKELCDSVFGNENFIAQLIWERAYSPKNDAKYISNSHDYVLMYARNIDAFDIGRLPRTEQANARYSNPDNDPRGDWKSSDMSVKTYTASCDYPITTPSGKIVEPPAGRCWRLSPKAFGERLRDNRIWFGPKGDSTPSIKRFLSELKFEGMAPTSILFYKEVGHSQEGAQELTRDMFNKGVFSGPKPVRLLNRLCTLSNMQADGDDAALDFFAGSGTTGHAVISQNREDDGNRKYILCEMGEYFNSVTKPRIEKAIYSKDWSEGKPLSRKGVSQCFKYLRLEQYEDTLNNIQLAADPTKPDLGFDESCLLGYMLDVESRESLFNQEWFTNPFDVKMLITRNNERKEEQIDVVETFNYLLGLKVERTTWPVNGVQLVWGTTRKGERTLVVWRDVTKVTGESLAEAVKTMGDGLKKMQRIYVNGDNNLAALLPAALSERIVLTEPEFKKRMFNAG